MTESSGQRAMASDKDFRAGNQKAFLTAFVSCKRLLTAEKYSKIRQNTLPSALSRRRHGFDPRWDYQVKHNPLIFLGGIKGFSRGREGL